MKASKFKDAQKAFIIRQGQQGRAGQGAWDAPGFYRGSLTPLSTVAAG